MGFQARLCFFFFLTFAIMCFARETPLGGDQKNLKNLVSEDYEEPRANPKHTPPHPPPKKLTQKESAIP